MWSNFKNDHFQKLESLICNELLWHPSQLIETFWYVANYELKSPSLKHQQGTHPTIHTRDSPALWQIHLQEVARKATCIISNRQQSNGYLQYRYCVVRIYQGLQIALLLSHQAWEFNQEKPNLTQICIFWSLWLVHISARCFLWGPLMIPPGHWLLCWTAVSKGSLPVVSTLPW